jgi:integrase
MATIRARKRKDGTVYTSVLYRADGTQSSISFDDPADAVWLRDLINRVGPAKALEIARRRDGAHPDAMTVAEWLNHHIDHLTGVTKSTRWDYRSYVRNDIAEPLGAIPLAVLTSDDIARWVQDMADDGAAGKTIANKHGFLSAALNAAVKAGRIPANPAAGARLPSTERGEIVFLSRQQYATLLANVTEYWRPLVEFLVASGARFGEVTALRPGDVDRDAGTVRISRAWKRTYDSAGHEMGTTKTRRARTINVPKSVLDKLDYSNPWLFVNRVGDPVRVVAFRNRVWYRALDKAGIDPRPRIHDLRHTCASWMLLAGVPIHVVSRHLGHESIKTTVDIYGHLDRTSARTAAAAIEAALAEDDAPGTRA